MVIGDSSDSYDRKELTLQCFSARASSSFPPVHADLLHLGFLGNSNFRSSIVLLGGPGILRPTSHSSSHSVLG